MEIREGQGPPKRSAFNVVKGIEPYFKILSLKTGFFDSLNETDAKIWICLMQKR